MHAEKKVDRRECTSSAMDTVLAFPSWSKKVAVEVDLTRRPESSKNPVASTIQRFLKLGFE